MGIFRPGGLELTRYALAQLQPAPGSTLLDVGCGDGTAAQCAQQEFGLRVSAVDPDPEAVSRACARGIDARIGSAAGLELSQPFFDIVLMECVLSLVGEKERALERICSALRPGGALILSDLYQKDAPAGTAALELPTLIGQLKALGMERVLCEDRTRDLKSFFAQAIMSCGSVAAWFEAEGGWKPPSLCHYGKGMGYFLLIVRKSDA